MASNKFLTGTLVLAGDITLDRGEMIPGVLIKMEREDLSAAPTLPMYSVVVVVPVEDLDAIHSALKRSLRVMEGEDDFRAIELVRDALAKLEGHR